MRILIVHNDYASFSGEEHAIETIGDLLSGQGHTVSWFRRSSEGIEESVGQKAKAFFSGVYSIDSRNRFSEYLKNNPVDLVQVQNLYPFISPSILAVCKSNRIPVVMRCPNYRLLCPNGLHLSHGEVCERCLGGKEWHCILRNCENDLFKSVGYALRNATARVSGLIRNNVTIFVVLSNFQKQKFMASGIPRERIMILPNGSKEFDLPPDDIPGETVAFVGRVSREKGISTFLGAARELSNVPFSVAGRVDSMTELEPEVSSNVVFEGFLSGKALDDFYLKARVLVFPSEWYEGFPNVIAKAMAMGKPVVASRIGAIPEIVDDGETGLLFEPGNAGDLIEKIKRLQNNPDLCQQMGRAGQKKARREYSEKAVYLRLESIYERAIAINEKSLFA